MRPVFVAALALIAPASLHAQAAQLTPAPTTDFSTSIPIAGDWNYARSTDGSEAVFRDGSGNPQLTLRCVRSARQVSIAKPATGAAPFIDVWTSSLTRSLPASFDPATTRLTARLTALDPLLDALAFSRGRIGVTVRGQASLVVPSWEEIAHVVEDCRV